MTNFPANRLRGRRNECTALDGIVARARAGHGSAIVIRGEAGIGKTALLEHAAARGTGLAVVRTVGIDVEQHLSFAGLHTLCAPLLDRLGLLPEPQRRALAVAFGRESGPPPDQFLVGLALLSLLAEAAAERPVLCLVDDVQWLDEQSVQAIGFVARRLEVEPVAIVLAVRAPAEPPPLPGLPELTLQGLDDYDARAMLDLSLPGKVDDGIRKRILAEARGNPLALQELPRGLTAADLSSGAVAASGSRPLARQIEESFTRRIRDLPPETQRWLVLAAAEPDGSVVLLASAARGLELDPGVAAPAIEAGLLTVGAAVRFRHPLARSAAYRSGSDGDRIDAHRALAEVTDSGRDPDRRAWHRASASDGPDEAVATELEAAAHRARGRGGVAAMGTFMERATRLSADPVRRSARALEAAQARFEAAELDAAEAMIGIADAGPLDVRQRARLSRLRAQVAFARSRGSESSALLRRAAADLQDVAPDLARETYLEAIGAAIFAGRVAPDEARAAASAAREVPSSAGRPRPLELLLDGVARRFTDGLPASADALRQALEAMRAHANDSQHATVDWLWTACPVAPEPIALELWDDDAWHELASRASELARESGSLATLPLALTYHAGVHLIGGDFATAAASIEEAASIASATGGEPLPYAAMMLEAWRGVEAPTRATLEREGRLAHSRGEGRAIGAVCLATAVLDNGLGRFDAALAAGREACAYEDLGFYGWALSELVEAATRCGDTGQAEAALTILEERTRAAATDWALGVLARSTALVSAGPETEGLYREAIDRLGRTRSAVHLARAHLVLGEWLRGEGRAEDARRELDAAHEMFDRFGARAFAARAAAGLAAVGAPTPSVTSAPTAPLTAQELQIAQLAGAGLTNVEIGTRLFLSRHTVDWHLRKVFSKLGVRSRRQLGPHLVRTEHG